MPENLAITYEHSLMPLALAFPALLTFISLLPQPRTLTDVPPNHHSSGLVGKRDPSILLRTRSRGVELRGA